MGWLANVQLDVEHVLSVGDYSLQAVPEESVMILFSVSYLILFAVFLFQTFLLRRRRQEITKLHRQRDVLDKNFCKYGMYDELPSDVWKVLDEIAGE